MIKEILTRGTEELYIKAEVEKVLNSTKKLKIYYGVDPSGSEIHIGHAVCLRKLQLLQKLGHKIIFLIGDFTGMIGDPTDRNAVRQPLTREQVLKNAKDYKKQVSFFLNFSGNNAAEVRFNSEWNDKLTFKDVLELSSRFTVQQLLERDMYQKRIQEKKPISLHEFIYPVIQGYDAVFLDADMQIGGTDQTFNMLQGRNLMKSLKNKTQMVMTIKLLEGSDGRKMSKSYDNVIGIKDEPNEMYGKAMSVKDELIIPYMELATYIPVSDIKKFEKQMIKGENPRNIKAKLAYELVKIYYNDSFAKKAQESFERQFVKKEVPDDIPVVKLKKATMYLRNILVDAKLASSKSEARRLLEQGGVKVDGAQISDREAVIEPHSGMIIQVGKRKFVKVK